MPSFAPISGTISLAGSSATSKRLCIQRAMASRSSGRPSVSG